MSNQNVKACNINHIKVQRVASVAYCVMKCNENIKQNKVYNINNQNNVYNINIQ